MDMNMQAVQSEVKNILAHGKMVTIFRYDAYLKIGAEDKTYPAIKVISMDIIRDYVNNFTDKTIIRLAYSGGVYAKHIYPFKNSLSLTLIRRPMGGEINPNLARRSMVEKYTAMLINVRDPDIDASRHGNNIEAVQDQNSVVELDFELISRTAEEVGMISCGGVFRQTTTESAIRTIFTNEKVKESNDANATILGVDMIPASNLQPRETIVIPHGMRLVDLPNYIQQKCGGVYNAGLGYYLQDRYWYFYPAYDMTRFSETERTMTFISVPKDAFPLVERTWRLNGKHPIAIASGAKTVRENTDANMRNHGNGVSYTTASSIVDGPMVTRGGSKAQLHRAAANTETQVGERFDKKVHVKTSARAITDNAMNEFSKIAKRHASSMTFVWNNSEMDMIKPGTMIKFYATEKNSVKTYIGVVVGVHHYIYLADKGFTSTKYLSNSAITIAFSDKQTKNPTVSSNLRENQKPAKKGFKSTAKPFVKQSLKSK